MDFESRALTYTCRSAVVCLLLGAWSGCADNASEPDTSRPYFPEGAALATEWDSPSALHLEWPAAIDNLGVALYEVRRDDIPVGTTLASQTSLVVEDNGPGLLREWAVYAVDNAGNRSVPLSQSVAGGDTPPEWIDAELIASRGSDDTPEAPRLRLAWTAAVDDGAAVSYEVVHRGTGETLAVTGDTWAEFDVVFGPEWPLGVVAVDSGGQRVLGPTIDWVEPDRVAPSFQTGALTALPLGPGRVRLSWPEAVDDDHVAVYEVLRNGALLSSVLAPSTSVEVAGLTGSLEVELRVVAVDAASNRSIPLVLTLNPTDTVAPAWPSGAMISVSGLTSTSVTLGWPAGLDNVGVTGYRLYKNGALLLETAADVTWATLAAEPYTTPLFEVFAVDGVGNVGPALSVEVAVPDGTVPEWPLGSILGLVSLSESTLDLAWPKASDDVGVTAYVIRKGANIYDTVPGEVAAYSITGLDPWTVYTFSVVAKDASGNASVPLSASVKTPDETAPTWALGAQLVADEVTADSVTLSWSPASDNVGVEGYRIYAYNELLADVSEDTLTTTIEVAPWTTYSISVHAYDAAGNETVTGPNVAVQTLDDTAPYWSPGSAISLLQVSSTTMTVSWPSAIDDVLVTTYRLYAGDTIVGVTPGSGGQLTISGLVSGTPYVLSLEAIDQAGNISDDKLTLTVTTPDGGPPSFPSSAKLLVTEVGPFHVKLSWTAATDDVGIMAYTIYVDGLPSGSVDGFTTTFEVSGLSPLQEYVIYVSAMDAAGNATDGPEVNIVTPPDALTTEAVYSLMRPVCVGCHGNGDKPYFESLLAFENGIVNDSKWVTPGNGAGSGLIALLSGQYDGTFGAMPPGQWSYEQLVEMNEVSLTLGEIAEWIDTLSPVVPTAPTAPTDVPLNTSLSAEELVASLYAVLGLSDADFFTMPEGSAALSGLICDGNVDLYPVRSPDASPGFCDGLVLGRLAHEHWRALWGPNHGENRPRRLGFDRSFGLAYVQVTQAWCRLSVETPANTAVRGNATLGNTLPSSQAVIRQSISAFYLRALGEPPSDSLVDELEGLFATYQNQSTSAAWTAVCATVLRDPLFLTY